MSFDNGANYLTSRGAQRLAKRIERYWQERGYAGIQTNLVPYIIDEAVRGHGERKTLYFVRSNIKGNGFPPREAA
jgi:hypothetical protein